MTNIIDIPAISILLLDDHVLVAEGLRQILGRILPDNSVIDTSHSIEKARMNAASKHYDFIITDLIMPGQHVKEFIGHIRANYPDIIMLVVSSVMDVIAIKECLALGVKGYVSKGANLQEFRIAFEQTFNGHRFISSDLSGKIVSGLLSMENSTLTKKEVEVLRLLAAGHKVKAIADMMYISPVTVMTHKRNLMQKLDLHSVVSLAKYAYDNHLT